jgi:hypothetical protein
MRNCLKCKTTMQSQEGFLKMTQNLAQVVIFLTVNQLILNNRLLFWNKTQFNHDWLNQYIFKGTQYGADGRSKKQ